MLIFHPLRQLKNGQRGVLQALGDIFGSLTTAPYILLDGDDRTGENNDGETLKFSKVEELDFVVIYAYIYEGTPNWKVSKAVATIKKPNQRDIVIKLNDDSSKGMVGIATLTNRDNNLKIEKLEKYYAGHSELDKDFGFGFQWSAGSK